MLGFLLMCLQTSAPPGRKQYAWCCSSFQLQVWWFDCLSRSRATCRQRQVRSLVVIQSGYWTKGIPGWSARDRDSQQGMHRWSGWPRRSARQGGPEWTGHAYSGRSGVFSRGMPVNSGAPVNLTVQWSNGSPRGSTDSAAKEKAAENSSQKLLTPKIIPLLPSNEDSQVESRLP